MNNLGANVEFIDTSQECIKMMKKLSRQGLMKSGKIVTEKLAEKIPTKRGYFKKAIKAKVVFDRQTGTPHLEVGYLTRAQTRKRFGIKFFVNATWFEFGTKPHVIQTKQVKEHKMFKTYELEGNGRKYGYSVQHPGMSSKNFLRNTVYENVDDIVSALEEKMTELEEYTLTQGMNIDVGGDEEID